MRTLQLRLLTSVGDELETIPVEEFTIAEEPEEIALDDGLDNQAIVERVEELYTSVLTLLSARQAAPGRGRTWLKLALGEALLTAGESEGDIILQVIVRSVEEGVDDVIPAP
jgi:hypothetical protein